MLRFSRASRMVIVFVLCCFYSNCLGLEHKVVDDAVRKVSARKAPSMYFAGQRSRYSFRHLSDPELAQYMAPDFVWDVRHFDDEQEFEKMKSTLRRLNPNIVLGCYISASLAVHEEQDSFPPGRLPLERFNPEWMLIGRDGKKINASIEKDKPWYYADIRQKEVRQAVISLAVARAKHYGFDAVCFDNGDWMSVHPYIPISKEEWTTAFMKFYKEASEALRQAGLQFVVNVACSPEDIPDAFAAMAPYIDGIMTERAFHKSIRTPESIYKELKAYEDVLKQGKKVYLIAPADNEDFVLLAIRPLAKKYGSIYFAAIGPTHHNPLFRLAEIDWDIAD